MSNTAPRLPFMAADPAHGDFQYLEDLACAYWYSEILFAAIDLGIFTLVDRDRGNVVDLAEAASCKPEELARFVRLLKDLFLLEEREGILYNGQLAAKFLVRGKPGYLGDFLLYRRYMKPAWQTLVEKISRDGAPKDPQEDTAMAGEEARSGILRPSGDDYETRNYRYVAASDTLMDQKKDEIAAFMNHFSWVPPIIDIGGGAGTLLRAFPGAESVLFDLPEVIAAARRLRETEESWRNIRAVEGDFRIFEPGQEDRFGLVIMSNFLHAYGKAEAKTLLAKAVSMLKDDGFVLIHDYFPDRKSVSPHKGPMYDLNMMVNTYNGVCHESTVVAEWLRKEGFSRVETWDLSTDTSVVIGSRGVAPHGEGVYELEWKLKKWGYRAREGGFRNGVIIPASDILTAPWVAAKCRYGCALYGNRIGGCPPNSMTYEETQAIVGSYSIALLLEGEPPGLAFHERLLDLERKAFLDGFHKALAFGAGPCPLCVAPAGEPLRAGCPDDGICRHPERVRPSMEGAGIDVYTTALRAGINLKPVLERDGYVKYLGLLLLE